MGRALSAAPPPAVLRQAPAVLGASPSPLLGQRSRGTRGQGHTPCTPRTLRCSRALLCRGGNEEPTAATSHRPASHPQATLRAWGPEGTPRCTRGKAVPERPERTPLQTWRGSERGCAGKRAGLPLLGGAGFQGERPPWFQTRLKTRLVPAAGPVWMLRQARGGHGDERTWQSLFL